MDALSIAREELLRQAQAIQLAAERMGEEMNRAVELVLNCRGKVVTTGMGKTGIIARKIAATLASTGVTATYLHPAEGIHGDLGILTGDDLVIAVSQTGATQELLAIVPYFHFLKIPVIAFTGNTQSKLAMAANVVISTAIPRDYEPFNLVPTASTTVALALGDALAVSLIRARNFCAEDFSRFHPGGAIGKKLLLRVGDLMHAGVELPLVSDDARMDAVIVEMTGKGLGCTAVAGANGLLAGIVTDGDLRRLLTRGGELLAQPVRDCMTSNPKRLSPHTLAVDALTLMEDYKITMLPVTDDDGRPVGMLHMHDLIKAGVV